jgi:hypothetical protein
MFWLALLIFLIGITYFVSSGKSKKDEIQFGGEIILMISVFSSYIIFLYNIYN